MASAAGLRSRASKRSNERSGREGMPGMVGFWKGGKGCSVAWEEGLMEVGRGRSEDEGGSEWRSGIERASKRMSAQICVLG